VSWIEVHARDVRAHHVERVGLHLHLGVVELVVGVLHLLIVRAHLVLDGKLDPDEHVVLGLRLDLGVQLLDLEAHPAGHALDERRLGLQPGPGHAHELPESLHDRSLLLLDCEEKQRHLAPPSRVGSHALADPSGALFDNAKCRTAARVNHTPRCRFATPAKRADRGVPSPHT